MASTFLQLTNRILKAFNEVNLDSSTFATADGFYQEAKDAINQAIFDVYTREDVAWPFAWNEGTFNTVEGTQVYTLNTSATAVDWESFKIESDIDNDIYPDHLPLLDYNTWRANYWQRDAQAVDQDDGFAKPLEAVRRRDNKLVLTPVPDAVYEITYEYYVVPVALSLYSDTSSIPEEFDQVVIYKALYYAYMFRDNIEQAALTDDKYDKGIHAMRRILIPPFDNVIPR